MNNVRVVLCVQRGEKKDPSTSCTSQQVCTSSHTSILLCYIIITTRVINLSSMRQYCRTCNDGMTLPGTFIPGLCGKMLTGNKLELGSVHYLQPGVGGGGGGGAKYGRHKKSPIPLRTHAKQPPSPSPPPPPTMTLFAPPPPPPPHRPPSSNGSSGKSSKSFFVATFA